MSRKFIRIWAASRQADVVTQVILHPLVDFHLDFNDSLVLNCVEALTNTKVSQLERQGDQRSGSGVVFNWLTEIYHAEFKLIAFDYTTNFIKDILYLRKEWNDRIQSALTKS